MPGVAFPGQHGGVGVPQHIRGRTHDHRGAVQHLAGAGPAAAYGPLAEEVSMSPMTTAERFSTWQELGQRLQQVPWPRKPACHT